MWENVLPGLPQCTSENTQERSPMIVTNVENLSLIVQPSLSIREFTQGRNPIIVMSVGRPSATNPLLPHIREYTQKRNNVKTFVQNTPPIIQSLWYDRNYIWGRNSMRVMNVRSPSTRSQLSVDTRELKRKKPWQCFYQYTFPFATGHIVSLYF